MDEFEGRNDAQVQGGMPKWVKVSLVVGAVVLLLLIALMLLAGGEHGPGRHAKPPTLPTTGVPGP